MTKPSPARYRTTNWSDYTAALRKRGSLLIWLDKDMTWLAPHDGSRDRPAEALLRSSRLRHDGPLSLLIQATRTIAD